MAALWGCSNASIKPSTVSNNWRLLGSFECVIGLAFHLGTIGGYRTRNTETSPVFVPPNEPDKRPPQNVKTVRLSCARVSSGLGAETGSGCSSSSSCWALKLHRHRENPCSLVANTRVGIFECLRNLRNGSIRIGANDGGKCAPCSFHSLVSREQQQWANELFIPGRIARLCPPTHRIVIMQLPNAKRSPVSHHWLLVCKCALKLR